MNLTLLLATLGTAAALMLPPAHAGAGHDHGHDDSAGAAHSPALPRFAAVSESFELVGVLEGRQLTLYLDRAADNAPVSGAQIELDIGGTPLKAEPQEDVYRVVLAEQPQPGVLPVTATITVMGTGGPEADLLAGELDLHAAAPAEHAPHGASWALRAAVGAGALAALLACAYAGRRLLARRQRNTGATA